MTCIVGVVENGSVFMGGDSSGIAGWQLTIRRDKKVFRNGDFLIGGTSSFRMLQLLQYAFKPPAYEYGTTDYSMLECYMTTEFINALRQCFKDGGYAKKNSEEESGGIFLVGFYGRLFQIEADYQVGEALDGYAAIGSGAEVALGSLHATDDTFEAISPYMPHRRVMMALQAAEHHNMGVRAPFYVEVLES